MSLLSAPVTVLVPATSGNLGPGYDSLALALSIWDKTTAQVAGAGIRITVSGEGSQDVARDSRNLIVSSMFVAFDRLGEWPNGLTIVCENSIPQARGLGSSAAAIVAGLMLACRLVEGGSARLGEAGIIELAADLEGHPDNAAACVLGGLTAAWTGEGGQGHGARAVRLGDVDGVAPVVFVPEQRGYTPDARAVLPAHVPLADAAFNVARVPILVRALTGSPELLFEATEDRLHQGYRAQVMPDTAKLVATLRDSGIAAVLGGAGPSVLALVPDRPDRIAAAVGLCPDGWCARPTPVAASGARVYQADPGGH